MEQPKCSCERFEKLEGASVPAYIKTFLEETDSSRTPARKNHYRCRVCGRLWEKRAPGAEGEGKRATLVRLNS